MSGETTDTVRIGRRADFFVKTPEWILVSGLSPQAQALYSMLLAHVNRRAEDHLAWPGLGLLAEMLGYRKQHSVIKYIRELQQLGAVDVHKEPCSSGRRNVYTVHETPPADYRGHRSLNDLHDAWRAKKAAEREAVQETRRAQVGGGNAAPAALGNAAGAAENQTERTETKIEKSSPPARRHADAGRRASPRTTKPLTARQERRAWEKDGVTDAWLNFNNPYLVDDIVNYVDSKWGCADGSTRNQVDSMAWRRRADGTRTPLDEVLNTALKANRFIDDDEARNPRVYPGSDFTPIAEMAPEDRALYDPAWFDDEGPTFYGPGDHEDEADDPWAEAS